MSRRVDASRMEARKELLLARAAIERLELSAHLQQVKAAATPGALARSVWPALTRGGALSTGLRAWSFLRRYPVVSSAASVVLPRLLPFGIAHRLFRVAKLGAAAFAVYQGVRVWREVRRERPPRPARKRGDAPPPEPGSES